jgi:thymidylate kinase
MMIVVLLGPDGSGKTTIADQLEKQLPNKNNKIKASHMAFRFGHLPLISDVLSGKFNFTYSAKVGQEKDYEINEVDVKQNSLIRSIIIVGYYTVDFIFASIFERKRINDPYYVFLFARYYHDYLYQTNMRKLPFLLWRSLYLFVPKPDFIYFLDRPTADILRDKPELPHSEIEFQRKLIKSRFSHCDNFTRIDCSQPVSEIVEEILEDIVSR